jgi:hypothetical protein
MLRLTQFLEPQSPTDILSRPLPKSPVSLSQGNAVPRIIIRSPHVAPGKFVLVDVERSRLGLDATLLGVGVIRRRLNGSVADGRQARHVGSDWVRPDSASACSPPDLVERFREFRLASLQQGIGQSTQLARRCTSGQLPLRYFFTSGQSLASSGLAASSGEMVAMVL